MHKCIIRKNTTVKLNIGKKILIYFFHYIKERHLKEKARPYNYIKISNIYLMPVRLLCDVKISGDIFLQ